MVPEAAELDGSGWSEVEGLVEVSLHGRPAGLHRQLRLFLRMVEWLPLLRYGRRFTSLDSTRRHQFLTSLQASRVERVRVGFWGLRTLALLGYYGRPAAAARIGYRPHACGWEAAK
ncbi:MAG: hypothetical protein AMS18_06100 [Gemmatimonas sp. SG8_17]|nr:MAG: hypothetical protein AMS18_06100 [Gemmatimonas sp. SG8_17]